MRNELLKQFGKPKKATVVRTGLLLLALTNQALVSTGRSVLPFDEEQAEEGISYLFTAATAITAWWKNNSFTKRAIEADELMGK